MIKKYDLLAYLSPLMHTVWYRALAFTPAGRLKFGLPLGFALSALPQPKFWFRHRITTTKHRTRGDNKHRLDDFAALNLHV